MKQPPGFVSEEFPHKVFHLKKSLYGLKQAPMAWFQKFSSALISYGFLRTVSDFSMFVYHKGSDMMILLLYVDDIILTGSSTILLDHLVQYLSSVFAMKQLRDLHYFLGIEAVRTSTEIMLTQKKYTVELLEKANMTECHPCTTPVAKGTIISIHEGTLLIDATHYRNIVGMLQYLCLTRPDICFWVNYVSQFMHAPTDVHMLLVKRILRYLKGIIGYGISLRKGDIAQLTAYSDSDWGNCPETARFIGGYAIFWGNSLISWYSKKQPTVSRSTTEAEYKILSVATAELEWLSSLFSEMHFSQTLPISLYCDNTSAIYLLDNPVSHYRTKHIKIHYHAVRELIESGFIKVQHITSEKKLTYLFTKGLCAPVFSLLLQQLLGSSLDVAIHSDASTTANGSTSTTADASENVSTSTTAAITSTFSSAAIDKDNSSAKVLACCV
ncbi:uncharacterized protein LOC113355681 [Papaver somniferum]|uniref:uncharacterized protein LOC113355681 n=1 Tax=Papaver somniferum TaxID=3469 RepID=UPI000E6F495C|nr:uncharacterized protein LOC113355681 [Papaver somniferum]